MRGALVLTAVVLLAVTVYYAIFLKSALPNPPILHGIKNDLFLHFCAFGALTIPVRLLWNGWTPLVALALLAALIEVIQIFQPGRTASFEDFAASSAGVLAATVFVTLLRRGI